MGTITSRAVGSVLVRVRNMHVLIPLGVSVREGLLAHGVFMHSGAAEASPRCHENLAPSGVDGFVVWPFRFQWLVLLFYFFFFKSTDTPA